MTLFISKGKVHGNHVFNVKISSKCRHFFSIKDLFELNFATKRGIVKEFNNNCNNGELFVLINYNFVVTNHIHPSPSPNSHLHSNSYI